VIGVTDSWLRRREVLRDPASYLEIQRNSCEGTCASLLGCGIAAAKIDRGCFENCTTESVKGSNLKKHFAPLCKGHQDQHLAAYLRNGTSPMCFGSCQMSVKYVAPLNDTSTGDDLLRILQAHGPHRTLPPHATSRAHTKNAETMTPPRFQAGKVPLLASRGTIQLEISASVAPPWDQLCPITYTQKSNHAPITYRNTLLRRRRNLYLDAAGAL
jgi:hypothetical protein